MHRSSPLSILPLTTKPHREHRRLVRKYFSRAGAKSQVLKVLALLVESGSVFCALMVCTALPPSLSVDSLSDTSTT